MAFFNFRATNIADSTRYRDVNVCITLTVKSDSGCQRSRAARRQDNWKDRMTGVGCTFEPRKCVARKCIEQLPRQCCKSIPRNGAFLAAGDPRAITSRNKSGNISVRNRSARGMNGTLTYMCALRLA